MVPFLLACLRSNITGGGGGGPFTITAVNMTQNQAGTSCGDPYKWNVALTYTGSPSGKTCKIEQSFNGAAFATIATGVAPTSFPYVAAVDGYYNKFGTSAATIFRVTDEATLSNTATSPSIATTFNLCL